MEDLPVNTIPEYCSAFNFDSSETVAYNNPLFPAYAKYGLLSAYPDYSAISHWHEDLEFIKILKGSMTYNINGKLVELTTDTGIMVNSRQLHYGFSAEHHECEFLCILLSPKLLQGNEWFYQNCVQHITENASCPYVLLPRSGWQASVLDRLTHLYASYADTPEQPLSCFAAAEDFLQILKLLYQNLRLEKPVEKQESSELALLRSMIAYIEDHYAERLLLEDIASAGACCKSRCSLLFKKYLRDTPITYLTKFRLSKSLASLLNSDKSITETAYEHGFAGTSYYCETFRKYYGTSPMVYKKMHRG